MSDLTPQPDTEQVTVWRNLLDACGQLSAAWDEVSASQLPAAGEASRATDGEAVPELPKELVTALTRAGEECAEALAGMAAVLAGQPGSAQRVSDLASSQRQAYQEWSNVHRAMAE